MWCVCGFDGCAVRSLAALYNLHESHRGASCLRLAGQPWFGGKLGNMCTAGYTYPSIQAYLMQVVLAIQVGEVAVTTTTLTGPPLTAPST